MTGNRQRRGELRSGELRSGELRSGEVAPWMLWTMVLLLSGGIIGGILLWPEEAPDKIPDNAPHLPVVEVEGVQTFRVREAGKLVWELSARRITVSADQMNVTAEGVQRGIYYRDGKPFLHWEAMKLRLNQSTRNISADGEVKATGPDGFTLRAARADWSHQKQELRCPVPVKATLRGATFEAPSLIYEATTARLHCPSNAKAVTKEITVEAGSVTYDTRAGLLRCAKVTRATANGFTVSGDDVVYETKSGVLRGRALRVEATGATLRGGSAVINTRARQVRLDGGIEIRMSPGAAVPIKLPNLPAMGGP